MSICLQDHYPTVIIYINIVHINDKSSYIYIYICGCGQIGTVMDRKLHVNVDK